MQAAFKRRLKQALLREVVGILPPPTQTRQRQALQTPGGVVPAPLARLAAAVQAALVVLLPLHRAARLAAMVRAAAGAVVSMRRMATMVRLAVLVPPVF